MATRINCLLFFIAILCIASVMTPGGADGICSGYCNATDDNVWEYCSQYCVKKGFSSDAWCKATLCCCHDENHLL
ncbi:hypothetical protein MtrunA17_Chr2g0315121 [Medicago truncatula]|uniref:LCR-like protein n=1 Tax=Medicago truncatula TaxID=3880 RepID=A0A072VAE4_MEDTR|nr:LCR-like protein [Medicago truncatula]RHN74880.1 hypothetical protein MtrunA17_Chr2g0315121 [Medicago truncatula]